MARLTPAEGKCEMCGQKRPLFHFQYTVEGSKQTALLCVRDYSKASAMKPERLEGELFFAIGA